VPACFRDAESRRVRRLEMGNAGRIVAIPLSEGKRQNHRAVVKAAAAYAKVQGLGLGGWRIKHAAENLKKTKELAGESSND